MGDGGFGDVGFSIECGASKSPQSQPPPYWIVRLTGPCSSLFGRLNETLEIDQSRIARMFM